METNQSRVGEINLEGDRSPREKAIKIIQEKKKKDNPGTDSGSLNGHDSGSSHKQELGKIFWGVWGGGGVCVWSVYMTTTDTVADMTDNLRE